MNRESHFIPPYNPNEARIDAGLAEQVFVAVKAGLGRKMTLADARSEALREFGIPGDSWKDYSRYISGRLGEARKASKAAKSVENKANAASKADYKLKRDLREAQLLAWQRDDEGAQAESKYEDE